LLDWFSFVSWSMIMKQPGITHESVSTYISSVVPFIKWSFISLPPTTHRGAIRKDTAEISWGSSLPECITSPGVFNVPLYFNQPSEWLLWWLFYGHFCAHSISQATFKGNASESKMKHPSDMPTPRFEHGW